MSTLQQSSLFEMLRQCEAVLRPQAQECYQRTIDRLQERVRSAERQPSGYIDFARYHLRCQQLELAIAVLEDGLVLCEPSEQLFSEAIFALQEANRTEDAIALARRAMELFPGAGHFKLWEALMLPVLYDSEEQIEYYRSRFSAGLKALTTGLKLETPEDCRCAMEAINRHVNFYLGYQGRNDRDLQEEYGQFVHRIVTTNYPQWTKALEMPALPPGGRIRVGYISAHFRDHSVSKLFLGWLREHNHQDFELFVYHNGQTVDAVTDKVHQVSDHFRHIPSQFEPVCRAILSDKLHVAVFLDVRHRRMAMMSALRLAPVQCVAWAHPVTSGSPMIDCYLSSDLMEPKDGPDHYSERLIRLPGIGVCYPKPVIPRPLLVKSREDFGLDEKGTVFLCCQSSFKYLPQHDDIFPRIAKEAAGAQFVFIALNNVIRGVLFARLQRAFRAAGLDASKCCVILSQLSTLDYWNLNLLSDVFLDSLDWSGGVTTLEAIACELPVVTLPGKFMRGRHSYGILTQLGITDTVAHDKDHYIDIAVRLGRDRQWRAQILERMKANHARLYSDTNCIRALEDFFRFAVMHSRNQSLRNGSIF